MKASLYNYSLRLPNKTTLFLNFYTLSLLALNGFEAGLAKKILANPNRAWKARSSKELWDTLINQGFLIPDDGDEIARLKESHEIGRANQSSLSLTIVPTLACNFRCVYCYQEKNQGAMTKAVEEALQAEGWSQ